MKILYKSLLLATILVMISKVGLSQSLLENTQLRFFSHSEFSAATDSAKETTVSSEIGDIELLVTSQVTEKISVLGEIIFTPDEGLEVDRLVIKYQFNDNFSISAGKLYTPIGLWNTAFYHQARVLTPTIDHPVIIADDSDFGVLDNKDEGIQFAGENISRIRFGYKLFLSNGFSADFDNKPNMQTLTYNVYVEPIDNFKIGVSGQYQKLKAGTNVSFKSLDETNDMNLLNASVMYLGGTSKFELSSEYYMIHTKNSVDGKTGFSGFFAYAGYKIKKFTPYVVYNRIDYDKYQEVYVKNNFTGSIAGLRYKFSSLSVVKLEAQFLESESFKKLNRIELMWAVGF